MYLDLWWGDFRLAWRECRAPAGVHAAGGADAGARPRREQRRLRAARRRAAAAAALSRPVAARLRLADAARAQRVRARSDALRLRRLARREQLLEPRPSSRRDAFTLAGDDESPERVRGSRVTASLMPLLGIAPQLGRGFTAGRGCGRGGRRSSCSATACGGGDTAAIQSVLGRSIRVNGVPHTVVGIMPRGASLPGPLAGDDVVWLPARDDGSGARATPSATTTRSWRGWPTASRSRGRRRSSTAFAARMAAEHPESHRGDSASRLVPLAEQTVARDQADAPRHRRRRRAAAAGGVRECGDAAHRARRRAAATSSPSAPRSAPRASRLLSQAVAECLVLAIARRRSPGWSLGRLGASRAAAAVRRRSLPPSVVRRHRRARRAVHRGDCRRRSASSSDAVVAFQRPRDRWRMR